MPTLITLRLGPEPAPDPAPFSAVTWPLTGAFLAMAAEVFVISGVLCFAFLFFWRG